MAYEIDFIGVGDDTKKDADAIAIRWKDKNDNNKLLFTMGDFKLMGIRWLNI